MPKYYATDVTASLAVCDLQDTLSDDMSRFFTGGTRAQADAARVQRVFSFAEKLCEKPIGGAGVMQFVGVHEDIPLYMVEAKTSTANESEQHANTDAQDTSQQPTGKASNRGLFSSDDSPLTSLGATPTPTQQSFNESLIKLSPPAQPTMEAIASLTASHTPQGKVQAAREWLHTVTTKALVLDINLSDKSFLPTPRANKSLGWKDLKIEVFLNGQLVEVAMVHGDMRRTTQHAPKGTVRISGTRIHRQVQKAWIYSHKASKQRLLADIEDAERRWNAVSLSHIIEAELRGRDRFGDLPPSADFFKALAGLQLPQEIEGCQGLGIIDVVITAGKGTKYGPDTSYLMKPTRMDDARYSNRQTADSEEVQTIFLFPQLNDSKQDEPTNDSPTDQHVLSPTDKSSLATPSEAIDLAKEFGPNIDLNKTVIDTYVNSRGKLIKGRTLSQKLGDVKKMKPSSMERELARLKDRYGSSEPTQKKQKTSLGLREDSDVFTSGSATSAVEAVDTAPASKENTHVPAGQDWDAFGNQNEAQSSLRPLQSTASISPQKTTKRITKASALAGSPTNTPVKPLPRMAALSGKSSRNQVDSDGSPVPKLNSAVSTELDGLSNRQSKETKTASQTRKSAEQTMSEVAEAFEIPDCCKGSCVTYDEDASAARLTGKARGGEFREESVLVGMRFVVV